MNVPNPLKHSPLPGWTRRIFAGLAVGGLIVAGTMASQGAAVVFSDTFGGDPTSLGLDVSTDYTLVTPPFATSGSGSLVSEGTLAKVVDAASVHYLWPTRLAPEGVGQFLAVNGFTGVNAVNKIVYKKTGINVVAGNSYTFQADLVALYPEAPANLQFAIEFFNGAVSTGVTVLSPVVVPDFSLGWGTTVVNMGAAPVGANKATITLKNAISVASGNDFGVDNIIITDTTAPLLLPTSRPRLCARTRPSTWFAMVQPVSPSIQTTSSLDRILTVLLTSTLSSLRRPPPSRPSPALILSPSR